jgi:FO synthase
MDESISRAAGASHGQEVDERELRDIVVPLGRPLEQRTTLYGRTTTLGRRLRPIDDDGLLARAEAVGPAVGVPVTLGRPEPGAMPA